MIKITFYGRDKGFKVEGHAGYDVRGKDIVCSAISAMAQQTLIGLQRNTVVSSTLVDGLIWVADYYGNVRTSTLMYAFEETATRLAKEYPQYIKIEGSSQSERSQRVRNG